MKSVLFLGTSTTTGKGGVAYVLDAYKQMFPHSIFISTTASSNKITNLIYLSGALVKYVLLLTFSRKIKIIHIHGASYNSFKRKYFFFKLAKVYGKKVIYHVHGAEFHLFYKNANRKTKLQIENFINNADLVICLSDWWQHFFLEYFKVKKIKIVKNIVNPPASQQRTPDNDNLRRFLFLGYIGARKGVWLLLDVIKNNIEILRSKTKFYLGGNGEVELLKAKIIEYGISDVVSYIGWVKAEEKDNYFRKADVFILPSLNEGLPIAILEAMSYKLPILATDVGGISEIVSRENGLLIKPGHMTELTEAISYFINADLDAMGAASYKIVRSHFPDEVRKELSTIYKNLACN